MNANNLRTKGYELVLGWRDSFKLAGSTFSYGITGTFSDYTAEYTKCDNPTGLIGDPYVGKKYGEIWGYKVDGLFRNDKEAAEYASRIDLSTVASGYYTATGAYGKGVRGGDIKYLDLNGDGYVNNGNNTIYDHGDLVKIGNTTPRYSYSIQGGVRWNGIGISMMWQGVGKRDWYPAKESGYFWGQYGRPYSMALPWHNSDRWSPTNRGAYWPRLVGYSASDSGLILAQPNTRYVQDASYIRLKNLTIDYNFPKELVNKIGLQALKIYVSGENLLTFSPLKKYAKNYDPEGIYAGDADYGTNKFGSDNFGDGDGYPVMKSYTIGLSITF